VLAPFRVALPDAQPMSLKGHSFDGNEQPLADVMMRARGQSAGSYRSSDAVRAGLPAACGGGLVRPT
jgi:hypothetical protein